ncbi:hypothetical protein [Deinococcus cellulosilyticus]|uniref:Uncharacterized protein n=1 Tax=Deinococcus cellulosilyticus (strain DSM 18568 / NBRC 106333 / KACC 11606 / 5516J-15) TaxID=1223518 RepID=A0A511NB70_DEIC1|nr:hypothetical protein [Deinococcus cellulosilyticus]GEM50070.1 hypothetical protein DC3_57050 [Deinococcus cellulosilyticus NBRC 106333 = KACC 11606]
MERDENLSVQTGKNRFCRNAVLPPGSPEGEGKCPEKVISGKGFVWRPGQEKRPLEPAICPGTAERRLHRISCAPEKSDSGFVVQKGKTVLLENRRLQIKSAFDLLSEKLE